MRLFAFGLGYCATRLIARGRFEAPAGTVRGRGPGVAFDDVEGVAAALAEADVALVSIPPDGKGDPVLRRHGAALRGARGRRIVYLSTVGVYGDTGGDWVDEESPTLSQSPRGRARIAAEAAWTALGAEVAAPVDILRLGGIYGPGRSPFDKLREGKARRVVKPGQVFNRIHVDDIAAAVETLVAAGRPGGVYNVVDGSPSPPDAPLLFAASLLGIAPPTAEPLESAGLSGMALSFYEENRRVRNDRLKARGWRPLYPSYREGLAAVHDELFNSRSADAQ